MHLLMVLAALALLPAALKGLWVLSKVVGVLLLVLLLLAAVARSEAPHGACPVVGCLP